jgi:glycosyltransferase involved in cell wall biosynthesis
MKTNVPPASKATGLTAGSSSDTTTSGLDESTAGSNRLLLAVRYLWGDEGITTQLIEVVRYLRSQGWEVGLVWGVSPEESEKNENLSWLTDHTETFYVPFPDPRPSIRNMRLGIGAIRALRNVLLEFRPSTIHLHSFSLSALFFFLRSRLMAPVVSTSHIEPAVERTGVPVFGILNTLFPNLLGDYAVAVSQEMKDVYISKFKVQPSRISTIHYGIDDTHFHTPTSEEVARARRSLDLSAEDKVVCLVGRLDPVKGHRVLFEALRHLRQDGKTIKAICAGEGGFTEEIQARAYDLGVSDLVLFPGFCDSRMVYWASDLKVLPSFREALPIVVIEAMLCGLPTIRTPASGVQDQIREGENGFVVPFNDSRALAERMEELFDDEERRERMANAAREFSKKRFGLEQSLGRLLTFYQDIQRPAFD